MRQEINNFINNNFRELQQISRTITKNDELSDDLLQEVLVQLYEKNEIKLDTYDDNSIKYYIVAVMKLNYFSKTSRFHYNIRKPNEKMIEFQPYHIMEFEEMEFDELTNEQILRILEIEFGELQYYKKLLFTHYLTLGSMNKVSKLTTIPLVTVSRYINEIKNTLRENVLQKIKEIERRGYID